MKKILRDNKIFYSLFFIWLLAVGIYLMSFSKGAFSLYLNAHHNPVGDIFFKYTTFLGDGFVIALCCLGLLFVKYRYAIEVSVSVIISSCIVLCIKNIVHAERPAIVLKQYDLHFVKGVQILQHLSFPSGHTAAAFSFFCAVAFQVKNTYAGGLFFFVAFLVAMSRVYLLQHFLIDVYAGSVIAVFSATTIHYIFTEKIFSTTGKKLEGSLVKKIN